MKKLFFCCGLVLIVGVTGPFQAQASNITIWDTVVTGSSPSWYNRGTAPGEDQEVEPNCQTGQKWDLEAFTLTGTKLSMTGGFNFKDGEAGWKSGHIFIDVNGDAAYGTVLHGTGGGEVSKSNALFRYDYAVVMQFDPNNVNHTFDVYKLNGSSLLTVWFGQNDESNPWRLVLNTGQNIQTGLFMKYETGLTNAESGFLGGSHNRVTVDLGWLPANERLNLVHFTYECGNDNLMGQVPIPGAVWLLATGLVGLGLKGIRRRRK